MKNKIINAKCSHELREATRVVAALNGMTMSLFICSLLESNDQIKKQIKANEKKSLR